MRMHRSFPGGHGCNVYLDGEKMTDCLMADDAEGWAACMFHDAAGRIVHADGQVMTEIRRGVVRFDFDSERAYLLARAHDAGDSATLKALQDAGEAP